MNEKRGFGTVKSSCFSKRSQITVFIIVGILILFAFATFLYITNEVVEEDLSAEGDPIIATVPQEFQPIQVYTENCLNQVGERGLLILGQQGGYIYPDLIGEYSSSDPSNSDGINLEPLKVPFWHYNVAPNEKNLITFSSLQPELYAKDDFEMSIESQLSRFVEENLNNCINNYGAFAEEGFEIEAPTLVEGKEIIVNVAERSVNFWLKMPVTAKRGESETVMDQFYVKIPLRLKHYYEIADEIAKIEMNHSFLELQALDLITTFSAADITKLPPKEELRFEFFPTISWNENEVKEVIRGMLTSYVPMLRYLGSDNFYRYEYPTQKTRTVDLTALYQKHYDNMILPLERAKNVEINFDYFGWEPYFDLNDKGGKIMPTIIHTANPLVYIPFSINHYFSVYDVSYPVLISIRDPNALFGKGFNFAFALEANIRNNVAVKEGYKQREPPQAAFDSMVCDESKRNTEMIRSIVVDSATYEPLEAVRIGLTIPEQDDCIMGITDSQGVLESQYPAIYGGVMSFVKEEYLMNFYPIDTYRYKENPGIIGYAVEGVEENVIPLHKKKTVDVSFKKKSLEKCIKNEDGKVNCPSLGLFAGGETVSSYDIEALEETHYWVFPNIAKSLSESETGTVILNRVEDITPGMFNDNFVASATVAGKDKEQMELAPGIYEVTAMVTGGEALIIPAEDRGDYELPQQVLDELLVGQLQWDTEKTYLTITPEDLYNFDEITFNVLSFNLAGVPELEHHRVVEDLKVMGELGNLSRTLKSNLEPRFS